MQAQPEPAGALGRQVRRVKAKSAAAEKGCSAPLVEDAGMCGSLRKIVAGLSVDPVLQEDLLQECLVCLWRVESEKPGRTRSWYLQNCRFHVQHWLASGRSVDSPKRARGDKLVSIHGGDAETALEEHHTNGDMFDAISFQDLVATLASRLKPDERAVLQGLADGLLLREVALKAGLSYPTALKYRRKIATLAVKLALEPAALPRK
jgi:DNA-directed RNA polymerase specialized sigma24 family protein